MTDLESLGKWLKDNECHFETIKPDCVKEMKRLYSKDRNHEWYAV